MVAPEWTSKGWRPRLTYRLRPVAAAHRRAPLYRSGRARGEQRARLLWPGLHDSPRRLPDARRRSARAWAQLPRAARARSVGGASGGARAAAAVPQYCGCGDPDHDPIHRPPPTGGVARRRLRPPLCPTCRQNLAKGVGLRLFPRGDRAPAVGLAIAGGGSGPHRRWLQPPPAARTVALLSPRGEVQLFPPVIELRRWLWPSPAAAPASPAMASATAGGPDRRSALTR